MKSYIVVTCILIIATFLCISFFFYENHESFQNETSFFNWWGDVSQSDRDLFRDMFQSVNSNKQLHVYSVFGEVPDPEYDRSTIVRVQFSGEKQYYDPALFDVNFIPCDKDIPNVIRLPYGLYQMKSADNAETYASTLTKTRFITADEIKKKQFCLFSVSNGGSKERNDFFQSLSQYKKVDSCGSYMNNLGLNCPSNHLSSEYHDFISQYKFMICFENTSQPFYLTEKLFNAYLNQTIPIYWGCPNVDDYVDMSSILYLKPNYSASDVEQLIEKIKLLDQDDDVYQQYYNSIFFKDGRLPDDFNFSFIQQSVKRMVEASSSA